MVTERPELSEEDKKRVEEYLNSPIHQVERKPFKPLYFVLLTVGSVLFLSGLAKTIAVLSGVSEF